MKLYEGKKRLKEDSSEQIYDLLHKLNRLVYGPNPVDSRSTPVDKINKMIEMSGSINKELIDIKKKYLMRYHQ